MSIIRIPGGQIVLDERDVWEHSSLLLHESAAEQTNILYAVLKRDSPKQKS